MAMLTVRQTLKLPACFAIGYRSSSIFQGLSAPMGHGVCLAHQGFLCHL
jgi:hypothetical protein